MPADQAHNSIRPDRRESASIARSKPSPRREGGKHKRRRVLVADDEHLVATGLASHVKALDMEVIGLAADGEAAVELAREHHPDIAVLDIRMPKLDGIKTAFILYRDMGIPTIIVSAYSDQIHLDEIDGQGEQTGVFAYVLKPVSKDDLRVGLALALHRAGIDRSRTDRIHQLEKNLANRRTIEQAKWTLVENCKITEAQAHERLQKAARDRRKPLVEIAHAIIEHGDLFNP